MLVSKRRQLLIQSVVEAVYSAILEFWVEAVKYYCSRLGRYVLPTFVEALNSSHGCDRVESSLQNLSTIEFYRSEVSDTQEGHHRGEY